MFYNQAGGSGPASFGFMLDSFNRSVTVLRNIRYNVGMLPLFVHLWALQVDRANRNKGIKIHVNDVYGDERLQILIEITLLMQI